MGADMEKQVSINGTTSKPLRVRMWNQRYLFLLMIPALIWVILICYAPMAGLWMAFINYKPTQGGFWYDLVHSRFVGLSWFEYFFRTDFSKIIRNTLATSLLTLLFSFPAPIFLAICLNEVHNARAKKFMQTSSYLPYFVSWVIASNIFLTFLSSDGVVNDLLIALHITDHRILFFQNGEYFWWIIALANTWKTVGYNAIIYLASVSGIDQELYEAAEVDGADRVQKIRYITLPELRNTICIMLILAVGNILTTGFEQQLLMGNNAILDYSDVLDTYSYRYGLKKGMYSYGTAVGLFKSAVSFVFVMIANKITARVNETSLF